MFSIADTLEALTGKRPPESGPVLTEAAIDSRQVIPGSLFVALVGERTDGHHYVEAAFRMTSFNRFRVQNTSIQSSISGLAGSQPISQNHLSACKLKILWLRSSRLLASGGENYPCE